LLHLAARAGDCEIVQLACKYGINVNSQGENGWFDFFFLL